MGKVNFAEDMHEFEGDVYDIIDSLDDDMYDEDEVIDYDE